MVMGTCSYLPEDFLIDILLRLPVKPLVRFRLVCKSWSALLKSRDFTTTHLNRSANHGWNLVVDSYGAESHTMSLISSEALNDAVAAKKIETPKQGDRDIYRRMVGSCNGLVCLFQDWKNIITLSLWNPATREFRILPTPRMDTNRTVKMRAVGFGYHLNDYKVVMVEYAQDGPPFQVQVEVFSTSTGSWRVFDTSVTCFINPSKCSAILKGVPYWLGFEFCTDNTRLGRSKQVVASFDMEKEVFRLVHVPDTEGSYSDYFKGIGVLHESLAIIYCPRNDQVSNFIDFWVIKDDGIDDCWSKVQRIGPISSFGIPLGCWRDGVVVLQYRKDELLVYDPSIKAVKKLSIDETQNLISTSIFSYMESLVRGNKICNRG